MEWLLPVIVSYLLGSITFSFVLGKLLKGIDVRNYGSGNAGATNTLRVLGKGPAILVLVLDIFKGMVAVWIGLWLAPESGWIAAACGLAVIIGHNWPLFFRFKGGKGIATTIGVMATLSFLPSLIAGAIAIAAVAMTRYVSLGSLLFTLLNPLVLWMFDEPPENVILSVCIWALAWWRHRSNIVKLVHGSESKLGQKTQ